MSHALNTLAEDTKHSLSHCLPHSTPSGVSNSLCEAILIDVRFCTLLNTPNGAQLYQGKFPLRRLIFRHFNELEGWMLHKVTSKSVGNCRNCDHIHFIHTSINHQGSQNYAATNMMCFLRTFHSCIRSHDLAEKHSHYHGATKGVVRQNRIRRP